MIGNDARRGFRRQFCIRHSEFKKRQALAAFRLAPEGVARCDRDSFNEPERVPGRRVSNTVRRRQIEAVERRRLVNKPIFIQR